MKRLAWILLVMCLASSGLPAKTMWIETGVDNWDELVGEDYDAATGGYLDDKKCSLREAAEAFRAARGVKQANYLHKNEFGWFNDCERDGVEADGDDVIRFKPEVKEIYLDSGKWDPISLSYLAKYGEDNQPVLKLQRLRIETGDGPGSFQDVSIKAKLGSSKSLFVINGGGTAQDGRDLDITIAGLSFENASGAEHGGVFKVGLYDVATLTIRHSRFINNAVVPPNVEQDGEANGGAISSTGGKLVITDSFFRDNSATPGGALDLGNGAYEFARLSFHHNLADFDGGAIRCQGGAKLPITQSSFASNMANGESDYTDTFYGGGAIQADCELAVTDSVFLLNYVRRGGLGGGAIHLAPAATFSNITHSLFAFNQAGHESQEHDACASNIEDRCSGGALRLAGPARVDRSIFFENISYGGAAGLGGAIAGNGSGAAGSGRDAPLPGVFNSHFYDNKASYPAQFAFEPNPGGALAALGTGRYGVAGNTLVSNKGASQMFALPANGGDLDVHFYNNIVAAKKGMSLHCGGPEFAYLTDTDLSGLPIATGGGNLQGGEPAAATCPKTATHPYDDLLLQRQQDAFQVSAAATLTSVNPTNPSINSLGKLKKFALSLYVPENNADGPAFYSGYPVSCASPALQRGKDILDQPRPPRACTPGAIEAGGMGN